MQEMKVYFVGTFSPPHVAVRSVGLSPLPMWESVFCFFLNKFPLLLYKKKSIFCIFPHICNGGGPFGVYFHLFFRWKSMLQLSQVVLYLLCYLLLVNLAFFILMF